MIIIKLVKIYQQYQGTSSMVVHKNVTSLLCSPVGHLDIHTCLTDTQQTVHSSPHSKYHMVTHANQFWLDQSKLPSGIFWDRHITKYHIITHANQFWLDQSKLPCGIFWNRHIAKYRIISHTNQFWRDQT